MMNTKMRTRRLNKLPVDGDSRVPNKITENLEAKIQLNIGG